MALYVGLGEGANPVHFWIKMHSMRVHCTKCGLESFLAPPVHMHRSFLAPPVHMHR